MIGTYASAALICAASLLVGRAVMSVAGRRSWSWLEPAVGLADVGGQQCHAGPDRRRLDDADDRAAGHHRSLLRIGALLEHVPRQPLYGALQHAPVTTLERDALVVFEVTRRRVDGEAKVADLPTVRGLGGTPGRPDRDLGFAARKIQVRCGPDDLDAQTRMTA